MPVGELSQARVAPSVAAIVMEFGGPARSLPEQLVAGRDAALTAIRKYVPSFSYNASEASQAGRDLDAWAQRNQASLDAVLASPAEELPAQLRLEMGSDRAQSFILATFTTAAAGLGPWTSGEVARQSTLGTTQLTEIWARDDAAHRLEAFALIVKLDRDGSLRTIFVPPPGASGFGAIPLWFVAVVLVIVAAALVVLVLGWRRLDLNNRLLRDICADAAKEGRTQVIEHCIEATKDLQISPLESTLTKFAGKIGVGLAVAGSVYLGIRYLLPSVWDRVAGGSRRGSP